jgi:hypothetical protein
VFDINDLQAVGFDTRRNSLLTNIPFCDFYHSQILKIWSIAEDTGAQILNPKQSNCYGKYTIERKYTFLLTTFI